MTQEITDESTPLTTMGVSPDLLTADVRDALDVDGYAVLPGVLSQDEIAEVKAALDRIAEAEGIMAGSEYTLCDDKSFRLHNLLDKDVVFDRFLAHPTVLAAMGHVMGPDLRLSMLNYRCQFPGQHRQKMHVDWYAGAEPGGDYKVACAMWALDPFTEENGATRAMPGSHRWSTVPKESLVDRFADVPGQVRLLAEAGDVIVFNSHLWHGAMDNHATQPRSAINSFYCRRDQQPEMDQNTLLGEGTRSRFSAEELWLLGLADSSDAAVERSTR